MDDKKYELAKRAFELADDPLALLNLYMVANHKAGLQLLRKLAEEQSDKFMVVLIDKLLATLEHAGNDNLTDSPAIPMLYSPTNFINVSMRMGGEFLSPLNLNSLSRWLTTANTPTISAASQSAFIPTPPNPSPRPHAPHRASVSVHAGSASNLLPSMFLCLSYGPF